MVPATTPVRMSSSKATRMKALSGGGGGGSSSRPDPGPSRSSPRSRDRRDSDSDSPGPRHHSPQAVVAHTLGADSEDESRGRPRALSRELIAVANGPRQRGVRSRARRSGSSAVTESPRAAPLSDFAEHRPSPRARAVGRAATATDSEVRALRAENAELRAVAALHRGERDGAAARGRRSPVLPASSPASSHNNSASPYRSARDSSPGGWMFSAMEATSSEDEDDEDQDRRRVSFSPASKAAREASPSPMATPGSRKPTPRAARSHAKKEKLLSAYREQGRRGRQCTQLKGQRPAVRRRGESRIECIAREIFQVRNRASFLR
jgi:hypothetical protein